MIDFVVDLVEEHVDLDGSQFSESILERWYSAHASQRNVVVLEFGGPCPPRSPLLTHGSRHDQQRIFPFFHEVFHLQRWTFRFHEQNVFEDLSDTLITSCAITGRPVRSCVLSVLRWTCLDYTLSLLRTGRFSFILHGFRSPRSLTNWIQSWLVRLETSRYLPSFCTLSVVWI